MIDRNLIKHGKEFLSAVDNHKYEVTEDGLFFPKANVDVVGEFTDYMGTCRNKVVAEGFKHLLAVTVGGVAANNNWYLAIFSGAYTPDHATTAATFASAATEITSGTEGYTETTRRTWVHGAAAVVGAGAEVNPTTKSDFTIATATSLTIRGAALLSEQIKGSTSGVMMSVSRFGVDRIQYAGDVYSLGYRLRLQDV